MCKVLILQGSQSDSETTAVTLATLQALGVGYECFITSAHRTPNRIALTVRTAEADAFAAIIACAGGSAHLPGMAAAHTILPVLAVVPLSKSNPLNNTAAFWSSICMPTGVPLAFMGFGAAGAKNAALMAAAIVAQSDQEVRHRLAQFRKEQTRAVQDRPDFTNFGDIPANYTPPKGV